MYNIASSLKATADLIRETIRRPDYDQLVKKAKGEGKLAALAGWSTSPYTNNPILDQAWQAGFTAPV